MDHNSTSPPFLQSADSVGPTPAQLMTARYHRGGVNGHLVGWHQAEYSSCASVLRGRYYLHTPAWCSGVEVPYGCMAELLWCQAYAVEDLLAGKASAWALFGSEWALSAAVALYEAFRDRHVVWCYPPRLVDWIRSLWVDCICAAATGLDDRPAAPLTALLNLADQLPEAKDFRRRQRGRAVDRGDREVWMAAALVSTEEGVVAQVSEDMRPFDVPYSEDLHVARGYGPADGGWANAVAAAPLPRYPGGGPSPPESAVTAREHVGSSAGPSHPRASTPASPPHYAGARIGSYDPVDHRDVSDASFIGLDHVPANRVPQGLARMLACDPEEMRGFETGTLLAEIAQTVVSLGDIVAQWARDPPGVDPQRLEVFLSLVGRRSVRATLVGELRVASGGLQRRRKHHWDHEAFREEQQAQRYRGSSGGWEGPAISPS